MVAGFNYIKPKDLIINFKAAISKKIV